MAAFVYMALATAMFFWIKGEIRLGDFGFMYQFIFGAIIVLFALGVFLVRPRLGLAKKLIQYSFILSVPYYVPVLLSFMIWIGVLAEYRIMIRGFFLVMYVFLGIGVSAATLYIFGERGIWYCLGSMIIANMLRALLLIGTAGFGQFLSEFLDLILSFANETGSVIAQMEVHDQTFAFGFFLVFLLVCIKDIRHRYLWLFLTLVSFLLGLKRIAAIGTAVAVITAFVLHFFSEKTAQKIAVVIACLSVLVSFIYIVAVHNGLFVFLENRLNINTMFRKTLYEVLSQYYEISVTYMGRGLGFSGTDWLKFRDMPAIEIHNDFLRMYVELGFVGYFVWAWCHFVLRIKYFFLKGGKKTGLLCLALSVYSYINYITDNTLFYYDANIAFSISVMACCLKNTGERNKEKDYYETEKISL